MTLRCQKFVSFDEEIFQQGTIPQSISLEVSFFVARFIIEINFNNLFIKPSETEEEQFIPNIYIELRSCPALGVNILIEIHVTTALCCATLRSNLLSTLMVNLNFADSDKFTGHHVLEMTIRKRINPGWNVVTETNNFAAVGTYGLKLVSI